MGKFNFLLIFIGVFILLPCGNETESEMMLTINEPKAEEINQIGIINAGGNGWYFDPFSKNGNISDYNYSVDRKELIIN